jgi:hypothetical protein
MTDPPMPSWFRAILSRIAFVVAVRSNGPSRREEAIMDPTLKDRLS